LTAISREQVDSMLRLGGGFERALARCAVEATDGPGFGKALVAAYAAADEANRAKLRDAFFNLWEAVDGMGEATRMGLLMDYFAEEFGGRC